MKSLLGLGSGGAISSLWEKIPAYVKIPVIFGAGVLAASELTIDAKRFNPPKYSSVRRRRAQRKRLIPPGHGPP